MLEFLLVMMPASLSGLWLADSRKDGRSRGAWLLGVMWHYLLIAGAYPLGLARPLTAAAIGYPVDSCITVALILGALVIIAPRGFRRVTWSLALALVWWWLEADLALMAWLSIGSAAGHGLARWTESRECLWARSALQTVLWLALLGWNLPALILFASGQQWPSGNPIPGTAGLLLVVPALLIGAAVVQFAAEGRGTAFPYDPPTRLVTGGIYAHLRNPMQLGICLGLGAWGLILQRPLVSASALVALMLFIVFKRICNGSSRVGDDPRWQHYRSNVPAWWPTLRRYRPEVLPSVAMGES